jgi:autotransporter translocation and assembly factor TamB
MAQDDKKVAWCIKDGDGKILRAMRGSSTWHAAACFNQFMTNEHHAVLHIEVRPDTGTFPSDWKSP